MYKCHKIYICFLLCTLSVRKLTSPAQGREAVTLPSYVIFQGPSLGSVWLQASESTSPFPSPAGEGTCTLINQLKTRKGPSADSMQNFLFVQFSALQHSAL